MSNRVNNQHFGKYVLEYFPWYSYEKNNLNSLPVVNESILNTFLFAFDGSFDEMILAWVRRDDYIYSVVDNHEYGMSDCLILKDGVATYKGISETIEDWEDVEKIRLRCILGTESKSRDYLNILDFYVDYKDIINDVVYSETGQETEVRMVSMEDFVLRSEPSDCIKLISDQELYEAIESGKYLYSGFLSSIYRYYDRDKRLSPKQIEATKKILYKEILKNTKKTRSFFSVKTTLIPNIDRITDYFDTMGLRYIKFHNFMLVY